MQEQDTKLPDFANPPVDETALSIQFAPIPGFGVPHFGLYWSRIRNEFGRTAVHSPITNLTEQFDDPSRQIPRHGIQFVTSPDARCWFLDDTGTRLLQLQRDRFIHNWRRVAGDEEYPRFPAVSETLRKEWNRLCEFLKSESLGPPEVNQCEVLYINHIEHKKGWSSYGELNKVIAPWSGRPSGSFLPDPERASMEVHYLLPNQLGRLHISAQPVIRVRDGQEVLQISLTARGAPKSSTVDDIFAWLELGRKWVVKGFSDFTAEPMHKLWERRS